MTKRLISVLLLISIFAGVLSSAVFAWDDDPLYYEEDGRVDHVDTPEVDMDIDPERITADDLTVSDTAIEFIMAYEGCLNSPKHDVSQYSIGYGCSTAYAEKYGFSTTYITDEEAYQLLLCVIASLEQKLNEFMKNNSVSLTQNQYDALISFTFNVGSDWLSKNYRLTNLVIEGEYTINQFACAMGVWCHVVSGDESKVLNELLNRRIDEIKMFLFGVYEFPKEASKGYSFCPVFYHSNGGTAQTDIGIYLCGEPFDELITGKHEEEEALIGWYTEDGERITPTTEVPDLGRLDLYAEWGDEEDVPDDDYPEPNYPPKVTDQNVDPDHKPAEEDEENEEDLPLDEEGNPWVDVIDIFSDVTEKSWYRYELNDLYNTGVINGYEDNTFRPNQKVTSGEALKMILLASGYEEPERAPSHWARCYLDLAIEEGILERYEISDLDVSISRAMVAKVAANALKIDRISSENPFHDTNNGYVLALYDYDILTGYEDGTYRPNQSLTRAELAVIVWRIQQQFS